MKRVASIPTIALQVWAKEYNGSNNWFGLPKDCLLYTSDAADEEDSVDLGGRRIIKKKILQKKLNSSEFRYFRTAEGKI